MLDLDPGTDQLFMFDGSEGTNELDPRFSPDGTTLLFERYGADASNEGGYRLVVAPLDGDGTAMPIGPGHGTGTSGGAATEFSPDGTQVLAVYKDDARRGCSSIDGSGDQRLSWSEWRRELAAPRALSSKRHGAGGLEPPARRLPGQRLYRQPKEPCSAVQLDGDPHGVEPDGNVRRHAAGHSRSR